jgi:hypothetical protein
MWGAGRCWQASAGLAKWLELGDGRCTLTPHGVPEVPVELESEPEVRRHPQDTLETERCIGRHSPLAADNLVEPGERDAQANSEGGLADIQRPEEFLKKHLSGICRGPLRRQAPSRTSASLRGARPSGSQRFRLRKHLLPPSENRRGTGC